MALSLGASVGILEGSGREADVLLADRDWIASANLVRLPPDAVRLREFLLRDPAG